MDRSIYRPFQLRDTTYQLQELDGTVMRGSVAANHLKVFYYCEEHQTICSIQHTEFALHAASVSSTSVHASTVIGTLNQDLLKTPPYLVSIKLGHSALPDNRSLVYLPTVIPSAFTSHNLHSRFYSTISELEPTDLNPVRYIRYTSSSSIFTGHIHEALLENSNIRDLETWALAALPFR